MEYLRNHVSGHFQPKIWIPDIICLLEALTSNSYTIQDALGPYVNPLCIMTPTLWGGDNSSKSESSRPH